MKLTLGFSPCPNDTFIFDALVNRKIETGSWEFDVVLEDVQTLNEWATAGKLDITKISYATLPLILDQYVALPSGGAMGKGVGPLLISAEAPEKRPPVEKSSIAIPGRYTTAHMLFSRAFPDAPHKHFMVFNEIEDAVLKGQVEYGVIIHENRFTYQQKGLYKHLDLGEYWEDQTGLPIPLGAIVMKRSFTAGQLREINSLIRRSIEFAFANRNLIPEYVKCHAQEMEESVMRQHIELYVNDFSIEPGEAGRNAVRQLLATFDVDPGKQQVFAEILACPIRAKPRGATGKKRPFAP